MTRNEGEAEDVTGLFRKFGGDAKAYREFEPAPEAESARQVAWALVPGGRPAVDGAQGAPMAAASVVVPPAVVSPADVSPVGGASRIPAPKATVPAVFPKTAAAVAVSFPAASKPAATAIPAAMPAPATAPIPAESLAPSAAAPRPLDLLFARLAGTAGQAAPSQGPLSRWRRPS
jgi:hypothetical protein